MKDLDVVRVDPSFLGPFPARSGFNTFVEGARRAPLTPTFWERAAASFLTNHADPPTQGDVRLREGAKAPTFGEDVFTAPPSAETSTSGVCGGPEGGRGDQTDNPCAPGNRSFPL